MVHYQVSKSGGQIHNKSKAVSVYSGENMNAQMKLIVRKGAFYKTTETDRHCKTAEVNSRAGGNKSVG
jgi:predicted glycosyltransferase